MKRLLRTLILALVRILGAPRARRAAHTARPKPVATPRILLIRPDHVGDLVMATPVLQALKDQLPDAHLTMMVGPWSSEVVARHPAIDLLTTCPFPGFQRAPQGALTPYLLLFSTARKLRRDNYDLAINLRPDFWWGAALLYLTGIPRRVGYALAPATPFLTHTLPFTEHEHSTVYNLRLTSAGLQALGYPPLAQPYTPARYPQQVIPDADEQAWVRERLQNAGILAETPLVVIHPGTGGAVKLWRSEGWSHIADELGTTTILPRSARIVLSGSTYELSLLETIAQHMHTPPLLLSDMTIGQLAALLKRAQLVLGVDSGPLHLATAQGTPTLRLYGPTDTHIFGPWGDPLRNRVIASTHRCPGCAMIPCGRLDFRPDELEQHPCVRLISDQQVEQAITSLLPHTSLASPATDRSV